MSSWVNQSLERVTSLISEMIRPSKPIIHQNHFVELRNIIMDTGKDIILEMEYLEKERDFIKKDCILLEKRNALAEADKLKFQVELRKSEKECQELKRLLRQINDKMVCDLNAKIDKMEDQIFEKDHMIRAFRQKGEFWEKQIADMEKELKELKDQKLVSDGILEEMRLEQREANRAMEEQKRVNLEKQVEANCAMEELKRDNLESSENTKTLRCQMLAAEMKCKEFEKIVEEMKCKEFEADQTVEELQSCNLRAYDVMEGLRKHILAFEVEKMRFEEIIEKMKRKELKSDETVKELRSRNLKAQDAIEGVKKEFELEKTRFEEIIEQMKRKELKADETVKELRIRNLEAHDAIEGLKECIVAFEVEKMKFEEIIEEMKRKELKADETVSDLRSRNSKACDALEGLKKDFKVEKTRFEETIKEMKCKELKADETANVLRSRNLEADHAIEGLKKRIVAFEEEKRRYDQIVLEMKHKQIDTEQALDNLMRENLEAIDDLKRVIVKKSMATKGAKDAKGSFCIGEKQNLESGSSTSIERASIVLQQRDAVEIIDSKDEAIPGESALNSELCPNLGEKEKISSVPSPRQSGLLVDFFPRRKRCPRANGDGNSRPRKKQVLVASHERDVSLTADMSGNPNSGFARTVSSSNSKPVTVCGSPSQPLMSNRSSSENYSDSDDDSCSDSHMDEIVRSLQREMLRKK